MHELTIDRRETLFCIAITFLVRMETTNVQDEVASRIWIKFQELIYEQIIYRRGFVFFLQISRFSSQKG